MSKQTTLHVLPKDEDSSLNLYGKTDAIVTVLISIHTSVEEASRVEILAIYLPIFCFQHAL